MTKRYWEPNHNSWVPIFPSPTASSASCLGAHHKKKWLEHSVAGSNLHVVGVDVVLFAVGAEAVIAGGTMSVHRDRHATSLAVVLRGGLVTLVQPRDVRITYATPQEVPDDLLGLRLL